MEHLNLDVGTFLFCVLVEDEHDHPSDYATRKQSPVSPILLLDRNYVSQGSLKLLLDLVLVTLDVHQDQLPMHVILVLLWDVP